MFCGECAIRSRLGRIFVCKMRERQTSGSIMSYKSNTLNGNYIYKFTKPMMVVFHSYAVNRPNPGKCFTKS